MRRAATAPRRIGFRPLIVVGLWLGLLALSPARADDLTPPPWNQGASNALRAHWGFEDADHPTNPDSVHNPFQGQVQTTTFDTARYAPTLLGRKGVWVIGDPAYVGASLLPPGRMTISVPNANRPGTKEVWIQVTYLGVFGKPKVEIPGFTSAGESVRNADADGQPPYTEDPDPNQPWKHLLSKWTSPTCPATETVNISAEQGKVAIDQLVVDTVCRSTLGGR